jgi:hypothetical protein
VNFASYPGECRPVNVGARSSTVKLLKEQRQQFILSLNDDGYDHETQAYLNVGQRNWHVNVDPVLRGCGRTATIIYRKSAVHSS